MGGIATIRARPGAVLGDIQPFEPPTSTGPHLAAAPSVVPATGGRDVASRVRRPRWVLPLTYVGLVGLGAALGAAWVWRDRWRDELASWWTVVAVVAVLAVVVLAAGIRARPPKSAAHPALQVRRGQHWNYRPVMRPLGRRGLVPNVFVDGDSFAEAAWPGADLAVSRRWTVDASERVASRFGTEVAVVLGVGGGGAPGRDHVRVVAVPPGGSMVDALWELVAPVDPKLPILFVTDDESAARAAVAHGVQVMPCRGWMALADRLVAGTERHVTAA